MGLEIIGVVASFATIFSGFGWLLDKNHRKVEEMLRHNGHNLNGLVLKVEKIETSFNDLRAEIPAKFVTKSELLTHMRNEERWQQDSRHFANGHTDELSG
jgi:hypothetical protein